MSRVFSQRFKVISLRARTLVIFYICNVRMYVRQIFLYVFLVGAVAVAAAAATNFKYIP